jgi:hypothetical protein
MHLMNLELLFLDLVDLGNAEELTQALFDACNFGGAWDLGVRLLTFFFFFILKVFVRCSVQIRHEIVSQHFRSKFTEMLDFAFAEPIRRLDHENDEVHHIA